MRENFVQSMAKKVEAQTHEESKFWSFLALCQANQVCKEENQRRNLTSSNFAWLCEMPKGVQTAKRRARLRKMNFAHHAKPNIEELSQK